jgi:hypothetical protein
MVEFERRIQIGSATERCLTPLPNVFGFSRIVRGQVHFAPNENESQGCTFKLESTKYFLLPKLSWDRGRLARCEREQGVNKV